MTLPAVPDTFSWSEEPWGPVLRCRPLADVAPHAFTSRHLRLSPTDGAAELAATVGATAVAQLSQVHGKAVVVVAQEASWPTPWPEADVLVSRSPVTARGRPRRRLRAAADGRPRHRRRSGRARRLARYGRGGGGGGGAGAGAGVRHPARPARGRDRTQHRELLLRGRHRAGGRVRGRRPRAIPHRSVVPGPRAAAGLPRAARAPPGPGRRQSRPADPGRSG